MAYNFKEIEENADSPFDTPWGSRKPQRFSSSKAIGQKRTFYKKSSVKKKYAFSWREVIFFFRRASNCKCSPCITSSRS